MKKKLKDFGVKIARDRLSILLGMALAAIIGLGGYQLLFGSRTSEETEIKKDIDFSGVTAIKELATVRSYYHNVVTLEKQPDGLFQYGWGKYGYKKAWIEYMGTVELGINFSKVHIDQPDEGNVVRVSVPGAEILNTDADESSIGDPIVETGIFTKVTTEDLNKAFTEAQTSMENSVKEDSALLKQAEDHAKELIKEFIVNIGELQGEDYTVEFVETEESSTDESTE